MHVRTIEGVEIFVVEARPLAERLVPGLERVRRGLVFDDRIDAGADLLHLAVVGLLDDLQRLLHRGDRLLLSARRQQDLAKKTGPAVLHQIPFERLT